MMSGADRDALLIQNRANVVRMDVSIVNDSTPSFSRAVPMMRTPSIADRRLVA